MVKRICITLSLVLLAATLWAQQGTKPVDIKIQSGEKWWGLVVDPTTISLPFDTPFVVTTEELSPAHYKANMLLSNRGRYLWSKEPITVGFDGKKLTVTSKADSLLKVEKAGRTLREAYLMCCHRNFPPSNLEASEVLFGAPIYEFGGPDALLYTQQDVLKFADRLGELEVPTGTILLPQGWNSPSGGMIFDPEAYPDPKAMVDELHRRGVRVMLTVTPYVMAAGRGYRQSLKEGALYMDDNGAPVVFQSRMGYTALRNLTTERVKELSMQLEQLQREYGVDGFYFDCLDAMELMADNSARLEEFLAAWAEAGRNINVAIYSAPMGQQLGSIASSLSSVRNYSWEQLGESLGRAVDASVLGFSRTSLAADLNFPEGDPELVVRTASLAALLPVAVIPYSVWAQENIGPLKEVLRWRADQSGYYMELARLGASSAEPLLRHLEYQFPRTGFSNCRDEFMIGSKWLVAPVVSGSEVRMVRLPKGKWRELSTGRVFKGPRVLDVDVSNGLTPIYEKQ